MNQGGDNEDDKDNVIIYTPKRTRDGIQGEGEKANKRRHIAEGEDIDNESHFVAVYDVDQEQILMEELPGNGSDTSLDNNIDSSSVKSILSY